MPYVAWSIGILATLENLWPLIHGFINTPPDKVFLGTVHHPGDYFYYLSQFAQGAYRNITTVNLYTTEPLNPTFVGWINVLMGKVFSFLGTPPIISYHLAVTVLTLGVFLMAYSLGKTLLGKPKSAILALFLFALFHAFPMTREGQASFGDYWNNFAIPRVRLGAVPHQLIIAITSLYLFSLVISWIQHKKIHKTAVMKLLLGSAILSSLQPVLWVLISGTFGLSAILFGFIHKYKWKQLNTIIFPACFLILGGVLPAMYLSQLFFVPPFSALKSWEAAQQTTLTAGHFLSATGPIFLAALVSLPVFIAQKTFGQISTVLFLLVSFTIFLSPLPAAFGVTHVRFMSTLGIFLLSVIATGGISALIARTQPMFDRSKLPKFPYVLSAILCVLSLILIPNHFLSLGLATKLETDNAYYFLPKADYALLVEAGKLSTPGDTFLVIWPYNVSFPAITGRRTYNGHPLLTIDSAQKDATANLIFNNQFTRASLDDFLQKHTITYVIAYSWTELPDGLFDPVRQSGSLVLLRVNPDKIGVK